MAKAKTAKNDPQKVIDAEQEQGFRGTEVDQTPNHAYTVAGVIAGEDTPETTRKPGERNKVPTLVDGGIELR